jgi:glycosyltransferase involved in cell wall biosynthesis
VKVTYVVPRYGEEVFGGAENACRLLAEHLAAATGWDVEVLTSTATDSVTWAPEFAPGTTVENRITVRRFAARPRHPDFAELSERVLARPELASSDDQLRWVDMQGPSSEELVDAVRSTDADVTCFTPYLFHPTVHGLPASAAPSVLHPAMHDEPPGRLPIVQRVFADANGLVFYSHPERVVSERLHPVATGNQIVLGLGVDDGPDADPLAFRQQHGLGERPYLVYVGRVDASKGAPGLVRLFAAYKEANPGPLALVLVGQVVEQPDEHPDIVVTGLVDETTKWAALRGAMALVSPSRYESFSLLLMEGWWAGLPALVNATCPVTSDHVRRSRGGFAFGSYLEFESAVEVLLRDAAARRHLAAAGRAYVEQRFRWSTIVDRYATFLERVAQG